MGDLIEEIDAVEPEVSGENLVQDVSVAAKFPVGVQDFEKLREEGYFYVDKTSYIYRLVQEGSFYFFCRPRYFGKSLLLSTMEAYFRGRQDLFEDLDIASLETSWQEYAVIRLDFSTDIFSHEGVLENFIDSMLRSHEETYGIEASRASYPQRLERIIRSAYEASGKPVVVLVDDYDKPILDAAFSPLETSNKETVRSLLSALNGNDYYLKFVFITGITKFESVNIFNGSSQARDISMSGDYRDMCGFLPSDMEAVCGSETIELLEAMYGGYRFSRVFDSGDKALLNPFSVLNALANGDFRPYWLQTGVPGMLVKMLVASGYDLFNILGGVQVDADDLMEYRWTDTDMTSLVYQTGYLTVSSYDGRDNLLTLSLPNSEVATGFYKSLLPYFTRIGSLSRAGSQIAMFRRFLCSGDTSSFVNHFVQAFADAKSLKERKLDSEYALRVALHAVVRLTGFRVDSASPTDVVVRVPLSDGGMHYIFCLRMDKGLLLEDVVQDAMARIEQKDYESIYPPFGEDVRIRKLVMVFSSKDASLVGWKEE